MLQVGIDTRQVELDGPAITTAVNCAPTPTPTPTPIPPPPFVVPNVNLCAVLGATPVVSTVGPTAVTGNLCITPAASITGPFIGYTPPLHLADGTATLAKAGTTTLYGDLNGLTCDVTYLNAQDIGGTTIVHNGNPTETFCVGTSLLVNGNLTLSGPGNYVFITGTTLDIGNTLPTNILLTNGATAQNIYWNVGSQATIGAGALTTVNGRIIANTLVSFGNGSTILGSVTSLTGAVTFAGTSVVAPPSPPA